MILSKTNFLTVLTILLLVSYNVLDLTAYSISTTQTVPDGGTITNPNQTIGSGATPAEIMATAPSGGDCLGDGFSYQWQSSTDGVNYVGIPRGYGQNYQPGALSVTTYFRRQTNCNGTLFYTNNRATITVIAMPFNGGCLTSGNQSVLSGNLPQPITATPATGGTCNGDYSYQWQSSTDNIYFTDIRGVTSQNLTFTTPLTQTTYFQRKTTCGHEVHFTASVVVSVGAAITYYNSETSELFIRNNCGSATGDKVLYTVPAGKHTSTISQADADAKAQNDINTNGQAYANANGTCTWYNEEISRYYLSTQCTSNLPNHYFVNIQPGTFTSDISQLDADQQAQQYAQAQADQYGPCEPIRISLSSNDTTGFSHIIQLANLDTGEFFWFETYGQPGFMFDVPIGNYNISISSDETDIDRTYSICDTYYSFGSNSADFFNVGLYSPCNISIY